MTTRPVEEIQRAHDLREEIAALKLQRDALKLQRDSLLEARKVKLARIKSVSRIILGLVVVITAQTLPLRSLDIVQTIAGIVLIVIGMARLLRS